jgi:hypothetical protein
MGGDAIELNKASAEAEDAGVAFLKEIISAWSKPAEKPKHVDYADGTSRDFRYDKDGEVYLVKDSRSGNFIKERSPDAGVYLGTWGSQSLSSPYGPEFPEYREYVFYDVKRDVRPNGDYLITDSTGVTRTYKPDGSKWVGDFELSTIRSFLNDQSKVAQLYKKHAGEIDTDKNGFLSNTELQNTVKDIWTQGGDTRLLATGLLQIYDPVQSFADGRNNRDGISQNDINQFKAASDFGDRGFSGRFKNWGLLAGPFVALAVDHFKGYTSDRQDLESQSSSLSKTISRFVKRTNEARDI